MRLSILRWAGEGERLKYRRNCLNKTEAEFKTTHLVMPLISVTRRWQICLNLIVIIYPKPGLRCGLLQPLDNHFAPLPLSREQRVIVTNGDGLVLREINDWPTLTSPIAPPTIIISPHLSGEICELQTLSRLLGGPRNSLYRFLRLVFYLGLFWSLSQVYLYLLSEYWIYVLHIW